MAAVTNADTRVVTGKVRLSYVHLFEAWAMDPAKDTPKFSVAVLIPKTDTATLAKLEAATQKAIELGKSKFGAAWGKKGLKSVLHDGDTEADLDLNPEYAGHMFMSVSSSTQPGIIDRDKQPITDSTQVYSGCYARVSVNAFPYNYNGSHGTSFGLNHVQKVANGDYMGGRTRAEDDFSDDDFDDWGDDDDADLIGG